MALLTRERLAELIAAFPSVRVAVVGDFFLDRYLVTDPALEERSLETGLAAHQVVATRSSAGHAGTVVNNLRALGVQTVYACGFTGDDGEGYELRRCLAGRGVDTSYLTSSGDVVTGTYVKPTARQRDGGERELERLDLRHRALVPEVLENAIIAAADRLSDPNRRLADAVVIADQVEERNHGAITDRVRDAICRLAQERPEVVWYTDSRRRIGEYRQVYTKPNRDECRGAITGGAGRGVVRSEALAAAYQALEPGLAVELGPENDPKVAHLARQLAQRTGRAVFLTLSEQGMLVVTPDGASQPVPPLPAPGPVDPTGAGDAATAGIVPTLALGASPTEAATVGVLVSGLTVRQLNTTGSASPEEVLAAWAEWTTETADQAPG